MDRKLEKASGAVFIIGNGKKQIFQLNKQTMKHLLYIMLILFNLGSCKSQNNMKTEKKITIPEINKEFEEIDANIFKNKNSICEIETKDKRILYTSAKIGFGEKLYLKNSYFVLVKSFFPNNKIRKKGIMLNNGSEYGVWYEFDENGKLIKEIDVDEGYDFGWHDIINYCHHNNIVLEKGYPEKGGIKTEIYKREEAGSKLWIISYYDFQAQQYLEVTLDGKTGKEINRRKLDKTQVLMLE